jgi:HK97 family phage major capsid protein
VYAGAGTFIRTGSDEAARDIHIKNSMSRDSDPDGGYFVLPALSDAMTKRLHDSVTMRRI